MASNFSDWVSRRRVVALRSLSRVISFSDWELRRRLVALRSLSIVLSLVSNARMWNSEVPSCFWASMVICAVIFDRVSVHFVSLAWRAVVMRDCTWSMGDGSMVVAKLSVILSLSLSSILSASLSSARLSAMDCISVLMISNFRSYVAICSSIDSSGGVDGWVAALWLEYSVANFVVRSRGGVGIELVLDLLVVEESSPWVVASCLEVIMGFGVTGFREGMFLVVTNALVGLG